jgi:hypothetical protein
VASPASGEESPRIKSPSKYPAYFLDDVPKYDLFEPGSEEAKYFDAIPDATATSGGSCVVVTPVRKVDVPQSIVPAGIFILQFIPSLLYVGCPYIQILTCFFLFFIWFGVQHLLSKKPKEMLRVVQTHMIRRKAKRGPQNTLIHLPR